MKSLIVLKVEGEEGIKDQGRAETAGTGIKAVEKKEKVAFQKAVQEDQDPNRVHLPEIDAVKKEMVSIS